MVCPPPGLLLSPKTEPNPPEDRFEDEPDDWLPDDWFPDDWFPDDWLELDDELWSSLRPLDPDDAELDEVLDEDEALVEAEPWAAT